MRTTTAHEGSGAVSVFTQRFSSTRLGARLARHLTLHELERWGFPYGTGVSDTAALLVAELAANAVTHGRVPGRDFELRLVLTCDALRVEVSDARGERRPPQPGELAAPVAESETGRGLFLVATLADRWGVFDRLQIGKTVAAEIDLPSR